MNGSDKNKLNNYRTLKICKSSFLRGFITTDMSAQQTYIYQKIKITIFSLYFEARFQYPQM